MTLALLYALQSISIYLLLINLEVHANKLSMEVIADIIIADAFASEEELKCLDQLDRNILTINLELVDNNPNICNKIILEELCFNRRDVSDRPY